MTKSQTESEALRFAMRVKSLANRILAEGNSYDCCWHKEYAKDLTTMCDKFLKKIR